MIHVTPNGKTRSYTQPCWALGCAGWTLPAGPCRPDTCGASVGLSCHTVTHNNHHDKKPLFSLTFLTMGWGGQMLLKMELLCETLKESYQRRNVCKLECKKAKTSNTFKKFSLQFCGYNSF